MALPRHEFFTTAELAAVLRVSAKTVLRMASRGALPCHQLGRVKRFRRADVERFLSSVRIPIDGARVGPPS